jgi:hypothetical protein
MGVKTVRSLGIDGGTNYSKAFDDLKKNTLLANGQPSFDLQFAQLQELAKHYALDYKPLIKVSDRDTTHRTTSSTNSSTRTSSDPRNSDPRSSDLPSSAPLSSGPPSSNPHESPLVAGKIQKLECDLRELRREYANTSELLYFVTKELSVCSERLGWSQDEVKEYRQRILELEKDIHTLYRSKTWKIGRAVTKPVEAIGKQFIRD